MFTRRQAVAARWILQLTTEELAKLAGVSVSAIAKFERCESELMGDTARRIEWALQQRGIRFVQDAEGSGIFYPKALDKADVGTLADKRARAAGEKSRSESTMKSVATDLHFVCKKDRSLNWAHLGSFEYETGNWKVAERVAREATEGGAIYLHDTQREEAWHGGMIMDWRRSEEPGRLIFRYKTDPDFNFRVKCAGGWSMVKAIVRRNSS